MHFSKMHAPFTYKMHAFMHAFLRKVSIELGHTGEGQTFASLLT